MTKTLQVFGLVCLVCDFGFTNTHIFGSYASPFVVARFVGKFTKKQKNLREAMNMQSIRATSNKLTYSDQGHKSFLHKNLLESRS